MKTKTHFRVLSLCLMLAMLVPMISIPAFATGEEAQATEPTVYYSENFDGKSIGDVSGYASAGVSVTDASKDAENHGDVWQFSLKGVSAYDYYICTYDGTRAYPIETYEINDDGTLTGTTTAATGSLKVTNAPVNPENVDRNDLKWSYASDDVNYAVVTGAWKDAWLGFEHLGANSNLKVPAISSTGTVTYAMQLYFSPDAKFPSSKLLQIRMISGKYYFLSNIRDNGDFIQFLTNDTEFNPVNDYDGCINIPKGHWFDIAWEIDMTDSSRKLYVDGRYVGTYTSTRSAAADGMNRDNHLYVGLERGDFLLNYGGLMQIDNLVVYEGKIEDHPNQKHTYYSNDFEVYEGISNADFYANCYDYFLVKSSMASTMRPYTEENGNTALKVDFVKNATVGSEIKENQNVMHLLSIPPLSYEKQKTVYFEAKYFIENGSKGTIESQILGNIQNGTVDSYINMWRINAATGEISTNGAGHYLTIGEWNTIGVVADLVSGYFTMYLNGKYVNTWKAYDKGPKIELCMNATYTNASSGWAVAKIQSNTVGDTQTGSFMVDDCRVMTLDALPESYKYLYNTSFETVEVGAAPTTDKNIFYNLPMTGVTVENDVGDHSMKVDYKINYDGNATGDDDKNRDLNPQFRTPALSYADYESIVIEADYFIDANARGQIQAQIFSGLSHNGDTANGNYVDLYLINFTDPKGGALLRIENSTDWGYARMSLGTWNTVSTVINLVTAQKQVYLNGVLVADSPLKPAYPDWANIVIPANQINVCKVNKSKGEGTFYVDNVKVFEGIAPEAEAEEKKTVYDFEEFGYSIGKPVYGSTLFNGTPALATYAATENHGTAVRLDMGPAGSWDSYALIGHTGSAPSLKSWDLVWDPANPTVGNVGETVYTFVEDTEKPGKYYTEIDSVKYYALTDAEAELIYNNKNVGAGLYTNFSEVCYLNSTYALLDVDLFIEEGSVGVIESQGEGFYSGSTQVGYFNLFTINMATGRLDSGAMYLDIGKWNNVKAFIELATGDVTLYANGVFALTKASGKTNLTLPNGTWSIAKVQRQPHNVPSPTVYTGGLLIDNVSVTSAEAITVSTVSDKFLTDADYNAYMDALLTGVNACSIRLSNPTGLRFATKVDTFRLEYLKTLFGDDCIVDMGTVIAPASYLDPTNENGNTNGVFSKEALEALPYTEKYLDIKFEGVYFSGDAGLDTTDGSYMVGSVVNFKEGNIARDYTGAGYVSLQIGETVYTVYGETCTRSPKQVAQAALADESIDWEALGYKELLTAYATYGD